ncbi:AmmeMemoRadiSam system protein B [Patescibacteria group bacterium]|nr:AmmeMemoRadiSam system protein B [Patescibacteria group bacterium]
MIIVRGKIKWKIAAILIIVIAAISFILVFLRLNGNFKIGKKNSNLPVRRDSENFVSSQDYIVFDYGNAKDYVEKYFRDNPAGKVNDFQIGITSHHLPSAAYFIGDFYQNLGKANDKIFVVVGPDHFESCGGMLLTTQKSFLTPFGILESDSEIVKKIIESGAIFNDTCFSREHSIAVQALFIKFLFPDAKIVALLLSANIDTNTLQNLTNSLKAFGKKIVLIGSVDFSHYRPYEIAASLDAESEKMILNYDVSAIDLGHVDSPPTIKLLVSLAREWKLKPRILGRANSFNFTGKTEDTTGYINAIFYAPVGSRD